MTTTIGGFKDKTIETRSKVEPITEQYIGKHRTGLDVFSQCVYFQKATDAVEAGTTTNTIMATTHSAVVGDIIRFTSGVNIDDYCFVQSITADSIILSQILNTAPSVADTFEILRPTIFKVDSSGSLIVTPAAGSVGDVNLIKVGGAAVTLGQKPKATSIPTVIATEQDFIQQSGVGNFARTGGYDAFNGVWWPTPTDGVGTPYVGVNGYDSGTGNYTPIPAKTSAPGSSETGLVVRNIPSGTQDIGIPFVTQTDNLSGVGQTTAVMSGYETIDFTLSGVFTNIGLQFQVRNNVGGWNNFGCFYAQLPSATPTTVVFGSNLIYTFRACNLQGIDFRVYCYSYGSGTCTITSNKYKYPLMQGYQQVAGTIFVGNQVSTITTIAPNQLVLTNPEQIIPWTSFTNFFQPLLTYDFTNTVRAWFKNTMNARAIFTLDNSQTWRTFEPGEVQIIGGDGIQLLNQAVNNGTCGLEYDPLSAGPTAGELECWTEEVTY